MLSAFQGIFQDNVTGRDIRLKGHCRGVTRGTPGVQTHCPSLYDMYMQLNIKFLCYLQASELAPLSSVYPQR